MAAMDRESVQTVFFAVIGYLFQYSCNIYLARLLLPGDYGDFAVALSMLLLLSTALELGASKTIPKYIHLYKKNEDIPRITGLLRGFLTATLCISALVTFLIAGIAYLDLEIAHKANSEQFHPLILALCFLPFIIPSNILASSLKCINPRVNSELPRLSLYGLTLLFLWTYTAFGFDGNDWSGTALFGTANLIVLTIYIVLAFRYIPRHYLTITPEYEWREWLPTSVPIMVSSILFVGTRQADLFMVEAFDASEASVGYFAAASQTAQGLITIYITLNLIYGSRIGKSITEGREAIKKTLRNMAGFMGCFCLIFLLCLIFFGKYILGLFGPEYIQAYPTMILLTIAASVRVTSGGYITFLQYYGKQNQVLAVQFGVLLLALVLNSMLIPRYSIFGAAVSSTICFIIMSIFLTVRAMRLLRTVKSA